jgi:hypothetical protein
MYVHKACAPAGAVLEAEKKAGGICANCGQGGTIWHVKGELDYYEYILNSVLYKVTDGVVDCTMSSVWEAEKVKHDAAMAERRGKEWARVSKLKGAEQQIPASEVKPHGLSEEPLEELREGMDTEPWSTATPSRPFIAETVEEVVEEVAESIEVPATEKAQEEEQEDTGQAGERTEGDSDTAGEGDVPETAEAPVGQQPDLEEVAEEPDTPVGE